MNTENSNSCKTEESILKNHPLYQNREDDLLYRLMKENEELRSKLSKLEGVE